MFYLVSLLIMFFLLVTIFYLNFFKMKEYSMKSDNFECGFYSMSNPSTPFNLPFFYITLMFLIFDLELVLLIFYPYFDKNSFMLSYYTMAVLILILILTFYEWEKDLINWF